MFYLALFVIGGIVLLVAFTCVLVIADRNSEGQCPQWMLDDAARYGGQPKEKIE